MPKIKKLCNGKKILPRKTTFFHFKKYDITEFFYIFYNERKKIGGYPAYFPSIRGDRPFWS
jgi:hypothetical protein